MLLTLVPALAAGVCVAWALLHLEAALWPALPAAAVTALLAWHWADAIPVLLAWDGQQWLADGVAGRLKLMLDLGPWMLLRWRGAGITHWLPLSARAAGAHWHGLRVAAHASAPAAAPAPAPTPHV